MPHHVTQRGNRGQQTFFGEEDVGPRHLPGDERPEPATLTLTANGAFGLLFYRWGARAGRVAPRRTRVWNLLEYARRNPTK